MSFPLFLKSYFLILKGHHFRMRGEKGYNEIKPLNHGVFKKRNWFDFQFSFVLNKMIFADFII